jgi:hypothetical protein
VRRSSGTPCSALLGCTAPGHALHESGLFLGLVSVPEVVNPRQTRELLTLEAIEVELLEA